ncbi:aminotransferase class I/II-fold pyridoxal phosphate-dependent enzyme [bacterium]|nr:aminotransferase class I/II-fold pyridoxal phosphate-dependent enzyme [bacterium]
MTDKLAKTRLQEAYSPDRLKSLGEYLIARLSTHLTELQSRDHSVLNWNLPEENLPVAFDCLNNQNPDDDLLMRFQSLIETAIERGHNLHHPRYIGHQVPASIPIAGLFDALGSITNQVMAIYEMGPWATSVERALIERWGEIIGLKSGSFTGLVTHGGSLANLTALLTARNVSLENSWSKGMHKHSKPPVLLCQSDSHYCVTRSAGILGLGSEQVIKVPLDSQRKMDANALEELLKDLRKSNTPIVAVCASACATPIGAFDPLEEIADACQRYDVWLHVDAAHGGAVSFSDKHRYLVNGITAADSFICDAHKTLFVPALCAFVFYRNKSHRFETFQQDAPYLFDPSAPGMANIDSGMVTIECTKRAATYGLWGVWSLFGPQIFGDMIDSTFEMTRTLYEKLSDAEDFSPLHEPECNILVFRYIPPEKYGLDENQIGELNRKVRRHIIESGEFYIVQTNLDGIGALRVTVMNPLTEVEDLDRLLQSIRDTALKILQT